MYIENRVPNGRVHIRHGWSDRSDLELDDDTTGSNVIAISGPAGAGKSDLIAHLLNRNSGKFVFADKDCVRTPTELEKNGKMPYRHISIWDIVDCKEPQLCSMNVGIYMEPRPEWSYWIKTMDLANKGVFIPEVEETVTCSDEFINRYLVNRVLEQHSELDQDQVLLFEISDELEEDIAEIFPEMTILRLDCERQTRAYRVLTRHNPKSRYEWVITSLKILDSVSFLRSVQVPTKNLFRGRNETREDMYTIASFIEEITESKAKQNHHRKAKRRLGYLGQLVCNGA